MQARINVMLGGLVEHRLRQINADKKALDSTERRTQQPSATTEVKDIEFAVGVVGKNGGRKFLRNAILERPHQMRIKPVGVAVKQASRNSLGRLRWRFTTKHSVQIKIPGVGRTMFKRGG